MTALPENIAEWKALAEAGHRFIAEVLPEPDERNKPSDQWTCLYIGGEDEDRPGHVWGTIIEGNIVHDDAEKFLAFIAASREVVPALIAEVERLQARLNEREADDEVGLRIRNRLRAALADADDRADAANAALAEATGHITTLADDLAAEVEAKYENTRQYPSEQRRYERDIAPVTDARAFLARHQSEKGTHNG